MKENERKCSGCKREDALKDEENLSCSPETGGHDETINECSWLSCMVYAAIWCTANTFDLLLCVIYYNLEFKSSSSNWLTPQNLNLMSLYYIFCCFVYFFMKKSFCGLKMPCNVILTCASSLLGCGNLWATLAPPYLNSLSLVCNWSLPALASSCS